MTQSNNNKWYKFLQVHQGTGVLEGDAVGKRHQLQSCLLALGLELLSSCPWLVDLEALH